MYAGRPPTSPNYAPMPAAQTRWPRLQEGATTCCATPPSSTMSSLRGDSACCASGRRVDELWGLHRQRCTSSAALAVGRVGSSSLPPTGFRSHNVVPQDGVPRGAYRGVVAVRNAQGARIFLAPTADVDFSGAQQ